METLKAHRHFSGYTYFGEHDSKTTGTKMKMSWYMPDSEKPDMAVIWLSGLTCTEENFTTKAGAQMYLSQNNMMVVCPDTSPRGLDLPGEHESYDFGSGAGFYVNATTDGYKDHYRMYDYVLNDVVDFVKSMGISKISLMGHSMGGHGALVLGLREPDVFASVSAFSPIVNPCECPWGEKAFTGYLGDNREVWKAYDACELVASGKKRNRILIDQGLADEFFKTQLKTKNFEEACQQVNQPLSVIYREEFDHSYYFISTFIREHLEFHKNS